jgi:hypothetical protein
MAFIAPVYSATILLIELFTQAAIVFYLVEFELLSRIRIDL